MDKDLKQKAQINVDLADVFSNIWKKKFVSLFIILAFLIVGFVYGNCFVKPKYVSEAKMIALGVADSGKFSSNDVAVGTYLVNDYCEMVVDRSVLSQVIKELNLDMSPEQLNSLISIKNPDDSRILDIYVSTSDPEVSKRINQKLCEVAKSRIASSLGADKITIFSNASLPESNSALTPSTLAVFGAVCGLIVVFLIFVLATLFNDKIKGEDDVEQYLGLCTLAVIPYNSSGQKKSSKKRKAAKR